MKDTRYIYDVQSPMVGYYCCSMQKVMFNVFMTVSLLIFSYNDLS